MYSCRFTFHIVYFEPVVAYSPCSSPSIATIHYIGMIVRVYLYSFVYTGFFFLVICMFFSSFIFLIRLILTVFVAWCWRESFSFTTLIKREKRILFLLLIVSVANQFQFFEISRRFFFDIVDRPFMQVNLFPSRLNILKWAFSLRV